MTDCSFSNQSMDSLDDKPSNPSTTRTIGDIVAKRYSRRSFVKKSLAVSVGAGMAPLMGCTDSLSNKTRPDNILSEAIEQPAATPAFNFTEIEHGRNDNHMIAPDHEAQILIRWGDPVFSNAPEFNPYAQSADTQEQQFGFNNDFIGYWPLKTNENQEQRALLCINHEYPGTKMMFPGINGNSKLNLTKEKIEVEQAATGCSVIEIEKIEGQWQVNLSSEYNRRITARSTVFEVKGPAAGHDRLKTNADPSGKKVTGTMNNCAGGMTPWGTYLSCEENINNHFSGRLPKGHPEEESYRRYGIPGGYIPWGQFDSRFDISKEPNEPNRFGWVVEIDPLDPESVPKKRTALGRLKHEGAESVIAPDGRLVIYMGDDQRFDYLYKFISKNKVNLDKPKANKDLLDQGTLFVARFEESGSLIWMPLVFGQGPLTEKNRFYSQADILIETRRAADLLSATPMDRPEDVVPNSSSGKVYVMLTNNTKRKKDDLNAANPRGPNTFGHIIEISEPEGNFASTESSWDFLVKAGNPEQPEVEAMWHRETSEHGWFASPDNGAIDPAGRLWISTDQGDKARLSGTNDGLWALETSGPLRGKGKMFFRCPDGAELCGPAFNENGDSLFLAVQHPGDSDDSKINFDNPLTRWPDFKDNMPPRPSIIVIQRKTGGPVG